MKIKGKIYPLFLVLAAIAIVELLLTRFYSQLDAQWEQLPVLIVILSVPIAIVASFVYLWVRRPGFLYPPSEFADNEYLPRKLHAY